MAAISEMVAHDSVSGFTAKLSLLDLPQEIILKIFQSLAIKDIQAFAFLNHEWKNNTLSLLKQSEVGTMTAFCSYILGQLASEERKKELMAVRDTISALLQSKNRWIDIEKGVFKVQEDVFSVPRETSMQHNPQYTSFFGGDLFRLFLTTRFVTYEMSASSEKTTCQTYETIVIQLSSLHRFSLAIKAAYLISTPGHRKSAFTAIFKELVAVKYWKGAEILVKSFPDKDPLRNHFFFEMSKSLAKAGRKKEALHFVDLIQDPDVKIRALRSI